MNGDFETAVSNSKVTFNGRSYDVSSSGETGGKTFSATVKYFESETGTYGTTVSGATASYSAGESGGTLTITKSGMTKTVSITNTSVTAGSVTVSSSKSTNDAVQGETVTLTPSYTAVAGGPVKYAWNMANGNSTITESTKTSGEYKWKIPTNAATGTWTVTCDVYEGDTKVAMSNTTTVSVKENTYYAAVNGTDSKNISLVQGNEKTVNNPLIKDSKDSSFSASATSVEWSIGSSSDTDVVQITKTSDGCKIKALNKSGTAYVVAAATYNGLTYELTYTVNVKALDTTLDDIENGDYVTYSYRDFEDDIEDILDDVLGSSAPSSISSIKFTDATNVTLKDGNTTISTSNGDIDDSFDLYAKEGFIGTASFSVKVNDNYVVTFYVPVTSAGTDIKESVTGSSTNGDVSFNVDDVTSGEYLYIKGSGSKTSFKPSTASFNSETGYDGTWSGNSISGWERFAESTTVTIPASQFGSTGKLTLYVVSVDSDGVATVGTLEVTQKSYSIEYNVVAGESVTFDQDDFEDLFKEYAEDNGDQTTRKNQDYPYVEYSHVTIAAADLPAAKSEGDLYYSSTALTSKTVKNEKFTDMDKMSFTAASKAKDTVTIPVTLVGTKYTSAKKSTDVKYEINVVISVVKEDIVYTVGVNDSVTFDARDFADYLNDYQTSYKKSTLDYVEFDVGTSNKLTATNTTGLLYQSYSSYYSGSLVESSNRFYYEPSRKQLDLGDVTYVTNRFSEVGKTVYIPFTVYGTKNEKAEGTLAIKVKNTMVFTDVVEGRDYFYDSVQWAVNNDITKGTSTTTFSPQKGCSRAEIVTFLWRAAGSPNPSKSTCSFKDVSPTKHADYLKAIIWATEKGITDGTTATTFSPDAVCTRAQIVTFLYRYAGEPASYGTYTFSDVSKTTHAAYYNAIQWAAYKGVTNGNGTTTFGTMNTCNRAEAVTFLYRYFE